MKKYNKQRLFEVMQRVDPNFKGTGDNEQAIINDILSVNEGISDILGKLIKYGKRGLLTAAIVLAVAFSAQAQQQDKTDEIIKTGTELVDSTQQKLVYSFIVGLATRATSIAMKHGNIEEAGAYKEIAIYYENLRDGKTPSSLSMNARKYFRYLYSFGKTLLDDENSKNYFINIGMNISH
jgi:hypothetical protein